MRVKDVYRVRVMARVGRRWVTLETLAVRADSEAEALSIVRGMGGYGGAVLEVER